jgi:hypothetical protein
MASRLIVEKRPLERQGAVSIQKNEFLSVKKPLARQKMAA